MRVFDLFARHSYQGQTDAPTLMLLRLLQRLNLRNKLAQQK
jgi:hypothetical protein